MRLQARLALPLVVLASVLFTWWGWKQGAYFGTVFFPASVGIYALLVLFIAFAPLSTRLKGAPVAALGALTALTALTLLSGLWSPAPASALGDASQTLAYAALFALGIWITNLLGPRMLLALAPVGIAGALVGVGTVWTLATGTDFAWYLHGDATLRFPIGYRNGNAAFLMICAWPLLALATETALRWPLRALAIASATMLIELTILAQSRGSIPAVIIALLLYLALSPHRLRAAAVAALAAAPALAATPVLLEVFRHSAADEAAIPLLRDAAIAIVITSVASLVLASIALRGIYPRLDMGAARVRRLSRLSALAAVVVALVGGSLFVARHGGPVGFLDQRVAEFTEGGYPDLTSQGVRYGANIGSNRSDFWRVSLEEGVRSPIHGAGAGGFEFVYLRERESGESPADPHSVEMLMLSELGVPGLGLFLAFVVLATIGALRSRSLGPTAAAITAAALAAAAQWFLQSSYDWLWHYPGITAPAIFLLGAAAAPALLDVRARLPGALRAGAATVLVAAAALAVPLYLADRYRTHALEIAREDPAEALANLERAADLNPLDEEAPLAEGAIASSLGDTERALAALREAADREPESYAPHYLLAELLLEVDPEEAAAELKEARRLNPLGRDVAALERRLERRRAG